MSTVSSFNDMMGQFLDELVLTFPEDETIYEYKMKFKVARQTTPRMALDTYMDSVKPYAEKLMAKDPSFFTDDAKNISLLSDMNIEKLWVTPEVSEQTRAAVWQYLQTLYILGTTITMFPPETLSMIESVAEKCAENMQESGSFDMSAMSTLFSSLMGSGGAMSPLALGGMGARPPVAPGAPKKKKPGQRKK
jgi:hypothetical protein